MTLKDLIKDKDYDYIECRTTLPERFGEGDTWFGSCKSENGVLITLDQDDYYDDVELLSYEEWDNLEEGIKNGLTIVTKGHWISG